MCEPANVRLQLIHFYSLKKSTTVAWEWGGDQDAEYDEYRRNFMNSLGKDMNTSNDVAAVNIGNDVAAANIGNEVAAANIGNDVAAANIDNDVTDPARKSK